MALLSISALRKSYLSPDGGRTVVVDVPAFSLEAGQQLALRGESGSGKTTFLHLIAGILAPDAGRIVLEGRDLATLGEAARDRARAETIGYIFQTFNLLQGHTALENVELGMAFGRGVNRAHAVAWAGGALAWWLWGWRRAQLRQPPQGLRCFLPWWLQGWVVAVSGGVCAGAR